MRMHGLPSRTGQELIDRLRSVAEANDIVILTERVAERLFAEPTAASAAWNFCAATARMNASAAMP